MYCFLLIGISEKTGAMRNETEVLCQINFFYESELYALFSNYQHSYHVANVGSQVSSSS